MLAREVRSCRFIRLPPIIGLADRAPARARHERQDRADSEGS